jgi:hypothetical protein
MHALQMFDCGFPDKPKRIVSELKDLTQIVPDLSLTATHPNIDVKQYRTCTSHLESNPTVLP